MRWAIGVPGEHGIVARQEVVAKEYIAVVEIGNNEIEIIDQLDAGSRISRRITPYQCNAQAFALAILGQMKFPCMTLAGRKGVGRRLIVKKHRVLGGVRRSQPPVQTVGEINKTPAL